ncbi:MAG TPA: hypothetical protein EYG21_08285 [Nitrospinaceae bacterium]|jgi:hypothetical protein|nr:hypothetical protein [Nitrospinaceae bacterium]
MDCETKSSIAKLRALRDELCGKRDQWKNAFAVKDAVVTELKVLKEYASDSSSSREAIVKKIDCLLVLIDPAREDELETCDG